MAAVKNLEQETFAQLQVYAEIGLKATAVESLPPDLDYKMGNSKWKWVVGLGVLATIITSCGIPAVTTFSPDIHNNNGLEPEPTPDAPASNITRIFVVASPTPINTPEATAIIAPSRTPEPSTTPTKKVTATPFSTGKGGGGNPLQGIRQEKPTPTPTKTDVPKKNPEFSGNSFNLHITMSPEETKRIPIVYGSNAKFELLSDNALPGEETLGIYIFAANQKGDDRLNFKSSVGKLNSPGKDSKGAIHSRYYTGGHNQSDPIADNNNWEVAFVNRTKKVLEFDVQYQPYGAPCGGSYSYKEGLPNLPKGVEITWRQGTDCSSRLDLLRRQQIANSQPWRKV